MSERVSLFLENLNGSVMPGNIEQILSLVCRGTHDWMRDYNLLVAGSHGDLYRPPYFKLQINSKTNPHQDCRISMYLPT